MRTIDDEGVFDELATAKPDSVSYIVPDSRTTPLCTCRSTTTAMTR